MNTFTFCAATISMLALAGCADQPKALDAADEPEALDTADEAVERASLWQPGTKPTSDYYTVRPDYRRCASPLCGGYWVSSVNRRRTECADGSYAEECYVAELNLRTPGVRVEEGDLIQGELSLRHDDGLDVDLGVLDAASAYAPVLEDGSEWGRFNLVYDTGIVCVTTPCPSQAIARLNTNREWSDRQTQFWGADEQEDALLEEAFFREYIDQGPAGRGALTFGFFWGWDRTLFVTNVYERKAPVCLVSDRRDGVTAWNFDSARAAAGLQGAVENPTLLEGTCDAQRFACTRELAWVSGTIDALGEDCVEHTNACTFRTAAIRAAGSERKAKGDWEPGRCGAQDDPSCLVFSEDDNTFAYNLDDPSQVDDLIGAGQDYTLTEGQTCAEDLTLCPLVYTPVCGLIEDAQGNETERTYGNICEFTGAIKVAAGDEGRARGSAAPGECDAGPDTCTVDEDCDDGFCGVDENNTQVCKPWAEEGDHCEGYTLPQFFTRCRPSLTCALSEPTGDAGGICIDPNAPTYPCGDLACETASEYCIETIGGVQGPVGFPSSTFSCAPLGACTGENANCDCLVGENLPGVCTDNGELPPRVTIFAP